MSIYGYTGLPGSGKSYDVVANQVMPALKAGRQVVTNIPLELDAIAEVVPNARELVVEFPTERVQGSPELIDEYAKPGVVLILDEVWRLWPAGLKAHQVPEPFRKLLAEHRHMVSEAGDSMQIVLVTQDLAQIGKFARDLIETTFHHTKLSHVGSAGSYRIDVYKGPVSGPNPPRQSRQREIFGRYDPAIFKLYKSHTMRKGEGSGANEASVDGRNNVWRRPMIYVGLAFVVAALAWGIPQIKSSFTPEGEAASAHVAPVVGGARPSMLQAVVAPTAAPAKSGGGWRVQGYFVNGAGEGKVAVSNGRYTMVVDLQRYCSMDLDRGPICIWEGEEITLYSDQRFSTPRDEPRFDKGGASEPPPVAAVRSAVAPESPAAE